jgi:ParB-like nuclease domain
MAPSYPFHFRWMTDEELHEIRIQWSRARTSGRTRHARVRLSQLRTVQLSFASKVRQFAALMQAGTEFPPITLVPHDERSAYWITDGCHRAAAALSLGHEEIDAIVLGEQPRNGWAH